MKCGTFHAVGVGPGDPELLTLKAVRLLGSAAHIYIPESSASTQTWVAEAVRRHAGNQARVETVTFSLAGDAVARTAHWRPLAARISARLRQGQEVVFVSLGDPLLYSTCIYLLRALRQHWPEVPVEIVPGISAYAHGAALTGFAVGIGKQPVTIVPVASVAEVESALGRGGTLVLMKIGRQLPALIDLLEARQLLERAVFVARAGLPDQFIETDLRRLRHAAAGRGHLAIILVHVGEV